MKKQMKERVRIEREIPKFRPLPTSLRKRRVTPIDHARFYGNYTTKIGKIKRFSFQIKIPHYLSGKQTYRIMKFTCQKLLYEKSIPFDKQGKTYTFGELMQRTPWIRVRKIRDYKAGMVYEP